MSNLPQGATSITLEFAREYLRADVEDASDEQMQTFIDNALSVCEGFCNRRFYATQAEVNAARQAAIDAYPALKEEREAALADVEDCDLRNFIVDSYIPQFAALNAQAVGMVINGNIMAAWLTMLGHGWANREEDVVASTNVNTLPTGAKRILQPYLWIGDLG